MRNKYCTSYPKDDSVVKNGICTRQTPDGYPVRCGPPWTIKKHLFIKGYCEIFTKAMRKKFNDMYFIDLFAGPGLYYHWPSGDLLHGSPLIASNYNFGKLIYNDLDKENIDALKLRTTNEILNIEFLNSDANMIGRHINNQLPVNSLSFCFIDPDNMRQLKYSTVQEIVNGKRVDLLINVPYGNAFKRGARNVIKNYKPENALDEFLGSDDWVEIFKSNNFKFSSEVCLKIIERYSELFYETGYSRPPKGRNNIEIIKNRQNRDIYFLLFLSRNPLGYKFWSEIVNYTKGETISMRF